MARQARVTSMITDRRQAHDHQAPCLCLVTTRPAPIAGRSKSDLIGDVLTGTMSGWYTSTLTSDHYVSAAPPKSAAGMSAWATLTPAGFFAAGTTVTPGNKSGYFTYTSATDNCKNTESMTQADTNGKPDNSTGWAGTGNIPAYAPANANYAGGQTCPSS
ncbi:MAG TPA: hypothetical protein VKV80_00910 [Streptosporangiaceae bacterium]|nr:hypothetical protein [Streptosporangiaceae bacterium]